MTPCRVVRVAFLDAERCRLAQNDLGFSQIALGFHQGLLALHHARAGAVAELFD